MTETAKPGIILPSFTIGFGMTVGMWLGGYIVRMPSIMLPSAFLLLFFVFCLLAGGFIAGRCAASGIQTGIASGLVCAALNLLILGSLLGGHSPDQIVPSALLWLPGSALFACAIAALGAFVGKQSSINRPASVNWIGGFACVGVAATFLLLVAGGLVTSHEAGLAVVDWPNSFGYNMFLFPLSRMTGGIYYEHTHRLMGSLVGLTTMTLAIILQLAESRAWLKRLGWFAVALVIAQGIMGGLRVTGQFTMSQNIEDVAPSITLAVIHGVAGQVFFCLMTAIAVFSSSRWKTAPSDVKPHAATDRFITATLAVCLLCQLTLGALLRHMESMLMLHISMAVIVLCLVVAGGVRAWGNNPDGSLLSRLGIGVTAAVCAQFGLGFIALYAIMTTKESGTPTTLDVLITTSHQAVGAILFAATVAFMLWTYRLLKPEEASALQSGMAKSQNG